MSNEAVEGLEDALGKLSAYGWVKMNTAQRKAIAKAARLQLSRQQSAQRDSSGASQSTGAGVDLYALKKECRKFVDEKSSVNGFSPWGIIDWVIDYLASQKLIGVGWRFDLDNCPLGVGVLCYTDRGPIILICENEPDGILRGKDDKEPQEYRRYFRSYPNRGSVAIYPFCWAEISIPSPPASTGERGE